MNLTQKKTRTPQQHNKYTTRTVWNAKKELSLATSVINIIPGPKIYWTQPMEPYLIGRLFALHSLQPRVDVRLPANSLVVCVDHAGSGDGCRRRLIQVLYLEQQGHLVTQTTSQLINIQEAWVPWLVRQQNWSHYANVFFFKTSLLM